MMNSDDFADAVNKSMAEVRDAMQETAERLEAEIRRLAAAAGMEIPNTERMRESNDQMRELLDSLRDETVKAAGQFSEGMNDMLGELRRLLEATMPGWASGAAGGEEATPKVEGGAKKTATKKSTKKATKKSSAKKAAKKTAKSSAKKAGKKAAKKTAKKTSKKSSAKKATKKTARKSTKKAAKKAR